MRSVMATYSLWQNGWRGANRGTVAGCYPLPANWRNLVPPWYWLLFWESCNRATMVLRCGTLHDSRACTNRVWWRVPRDLTAIPLDRADRYRCGGEHAELLQPSLVHRSRDRAVGWRRVLGVFAATAALSGSDRPGLAVDRASLRAGRLALRGGIEAPDLVGNADQEHGLASVLQQIDDARGGFFQVNRFAVREQVDIGRSRDRFAEALAHILLQEAEDAADFLKRKPLAAEFGDDGYLHHFFRHVDALVTVLARGDDVAFVPPLQLAQGDAANPRDVGTVVALLLR